MYRTNEGRLLLTTAASLGDVALDVPSTWDDGAVLARAEGSATTAGGELLGGVEALVVASQSSRAHDGASLLAVRAERSVAGLHTGTTMVIIVPRRLRRSRRRRRSTGMALVIVAAPGPATRALRRRAVG